MIAPKPCARFKAQTTKNVVITRTNGAAQFSTLRSSSMPRKTTAMLMRQKSAKPIHSPSAWPPFAGAIASVCRHHGNAALKNVCNASPPIQH